MLLFSLMHTEREGGRAARGRHSPRDLNEEATQAAGNARAKNIFIEKHQQFIIRSVRKITRRPIQLSDDEWSIGLIAFSEAVDGYRQKRGDFLAYAYTVMGRRLTDHYRKTARVTREIEVEPCAFTGESEETEEGIVYAIHAAAQPVHERESLRDEIEAANDLLRRYGFGFFDLTTCSPHTDKTRQICASAIACVLRDSDLVSAMRRKHTLPAGRICEITGIPVKTLDRYRRYIIAVTVLMQEDYPFLQEYLHLVRKEVRG